MQVVSDASGGEAKGRTMSSFLFPGGNRERVAAKRQSRNSGYAISRAALAKWLYATRRSRPKSRLDDLYGEAVWDMLLDLFAQEQMGNRVSVTSLCLAAHVPATTALRYVTILEERGWFVREEDEFDRRRAFIRLSTFGKNAMADYLDSTLECLWDLLPEAVGDLEVRLAEIAESIEDIKTEIGRSQNVNPE